MSWKITQWGLSLQATTIWSIVDLKISSDIRPVQLRPTGAAKAITFLHFIHNWLWAHRANATWWLHCLYSHSCWALCIHSHHMMHIDRQLAQSEGEREREISQWITFENDRTCQSLKLHTANWPQTKKRRPTGLWWGCRALDLICSVITPPSLCCMGEERKHNSVVHVSLATPRWHETQSCLILALAFY